MSEQRLDLLEQRLTALEARVRVLEPQPVAPPPVYQAPPVQMPPPPQYDLPKAPPSAPRPQVDGEYQLGAQWLPRIGAGLLVLGIAFLIGLAVTKGWITPPMLFGGAVVLCLAFIGIGQWMREEREDFGQILTGIGSCGMFLTLAGGHVYQDLYSGETLVACFVFWSLANLAYAFWRGSRSFLVIGIIGGLLASVMPLSKDAYALSLTLHGAILLVSALTIIRQKLPSAAIGLWIASGIALMPILIQDDVVWSARVAAVYLSTFVCLTAYLQSRQKVSVSEDQSAVGFLIGIAALIAFAIQWGIFGSYHVLIAAAACAAMGFAYQKDVHVRNAFLWAAGVLAVVLAPFGLEREVAVYVQSGLAIAGGLTAAFTKRDVANTFSAVLIVCASISFILLFDSWQTPVAGQTGMLSAILAASIALAIGVGKRGDNPCLALAFLAGWATISRLASILIALPSDFKLASFGVTLSWIVYGSILLGIGFVANLKHYRYAALTVLLSAVGKVLMVDMATSTAELRVAVLLGVGLVLLAGGYAYIRAEKGIRE